MSYSLKVFLLCVIVSLISAFFFISPTNNRIETRRTLSASPTQAAVMVVPNPSPELSSIEIIPGADFNHSFILTDTTSAPNSHITQTSIPEAVTSTKLPGTTLYTGPIPHIFFHSLIIYPEQAILDRGNASGYDDYMVTRDQFKTILQQLYEQEYMLIDSRTLYAIKDDGSMVRQSLYLPDGKKPIILSLDDLSYYKYMKHGGFANRLVLNQGKVRTEVITPDGDTIITDDGDVVPIIDAFIEKHPDFSWQGAKGIIALTGYEGILGYDTHLKGSKGEREVALVTPIVRALKNTGWIFASHSYSHGGSFRLNTITEKGLAHDINAWRLEVGSIVGDTNIFIGPFGQVFSEGDSRRTQLVDAGFPILYGVGLNEYRAYFDNHVVMDRMDIDGYRIRNNPVQLKKLLGISVEEL